MFAKQQTILRDLGDGLVMRRSAPQDADALAEFNRAIHSDNEQDGHCLSAWTRDLLSGAHPTFRTDDFTVIEESSTGSIISTMNLISQIWSYEGIKFGVGRPELVGTLPEFRNRGLVRLQFEEIHKWSAERGEMVQAITGIPFYYRQFGYEMALDLDGRRFGYEAQLPKLKDGETEPYTIRPADESDLPFIEKLYEQTKARSMIACERTPKYFRYELTAHKNHCWCNCVIEDKRSSPRDADGELVGFFRHPAYNRHHSMVADRYELKPGVSWLDATPSVARYLWAKGQEFAERDGGEFNAFGFLLGAAHPAYEALGDRLSIIRDPYAWYIRVPDLRSFLKHIKPVLEKRLAESIAVHHSRDLRISLYRTGLQIVIDHGTITAIESWKPTPKEEGDAAFPGLTFLQLLFGYRSFEELKYAFADCWCDSDEVRLLLDILFPKKLSHVYPIA
ncbi:MAG TPA: GNAT family N-acetyltransferase [Anaerolineales bacterium]|nr:GNAT family N-acetyltransferase [Anaerolineales bacterium]